MAVGEVQLGLISSAEADRYGNLSTSVSATGQRPTVRLPGNDDGVDILLSPESL